MPMYEYRCDSCGQVFEIIQKFSDEPLQTHEGCGGHVERLLSAPALQFKGSGWYITDYARKNGSSPSTSSEKSEKSEKKSESSKPAEAPKSEAKK